MVVETVTCYVWEKTVYVASTIRHRKIKPCVEFLQRISKAAIHLVEVSIESKLDLIAPKRKFLCKNFCDKFEQIRRQLSIDPHSTKKNHRKRHQRSNNFSSMVLLQIMKDIFVWKACILKFIFWKKLSMFCKLRSS